MGSRGVVSLERAWGVLYNTTQAQAQAQALTSRRGRLPTAKRVKRVQCQWRAGLWDEINVCEKEDLA